MRFHLLNAWRTVTLAACVALAPAAWSGQVQYPAMLVFGDSLSDTGNDFLATTEKKMVPAIPPSVSPYATYWNGRFSNGPVAVEYLWQLMRNSAAAGVAPSALPVGQVPPAAISFAFGGSTTGFSNVTPSGFPVPGLLGQVAMFANTLKANRTAARSDALYTVWSGSNDYLQNATGSPYQVVGQVGLAIKLLYASGARQFLVPNLPNLGRTPLAQAQGTSKQLTRLAREHNALLDLTISVLDRALPNSRFVRVDVFELGESLIDNGLAIPDLPATEFLAPGTAAKDCLFVNPATCIDVNLTAPLPTFLFWDVLHPTTQVHSVIGSTMYRALAKQR